MDKDKTPSEPRLDEDLAVEDESAEKVIGDIRSPTRPAGSYALAHVTSGHFNI